MTEVKPKSKEIREEDQLERDWYQFEELLRSTEREGISDLIQYLKENDFTEQPASKNNHLSQKGGLLIHSLNVYHIFSRLNKSLNLNLPEDTVIITSLLHDLCKINSYESTGENKFKWDDKYPVGHGEKSLLLLAKLGVELSLKEEMMIRWHMGPLDKNHYYKRYTLRDDYPEVYLLFCADYIASQYIEE